MSMIFGLNTLSDENIAKLLKEPALVWRVLAPDDPEIYIEEMENNKGFLARLFGKKIDPESIELPELTYREGEDVFEDLDKAWHGIHYLLTGTAWEGEPPLNFLLCGGVVVGKIDVGYGPARVLRAQEVAVISQALNDIDHDWLSTRYNPTDMIQKEIYPDIWEREEGQDGADAPLTVKAAADSGVSIGDQVRLAVKPGAAITFDKDGRALERAARPVATTQPAA